MKKKLTSILLLSLCAAFPISAQPAGGDWDPAVLDRLNTVLTNQSMDAAALAALGDPFVCR